MKNNGVVGFAQLVTPETWMSVWWLAIDRNGKFCSYSELKKRAEVAQGWPDIGDVGYVRQMPRSQGEDELRRKLNEAYDDDNNEKKKKREKLPAKLSRFLCCIEPGHLVVGIEGTRVKGICKMPQSTRYRYDPNCNYAHGLGPVDWVDWEMFSQDWAPVAPAQSVLAVAKMQKSAPGVEQLARVWAW